MAKVADVGVARIFPRMRTAATMTKAPGAGIYMPSEALEPKSEDEEESSIYDLTIWYILVWGCGYFHTRPKFPCSLLAPTYRDEWKRVAGRTEIERRNKYMRIIYNQLCKDLPLLEMIKKCLDFSEDCPSIHDVLRLLEKAKSEEKDEYVEMNKLQFIQTLQLQPMTQVWESVHL